MNFSRHHGGDIYDKPQTDLLDFSANINPFGLPLTVIQAAQQAVLNADVYPDPEVQKLTDAISDTCRISSSYVAFSNGACELIFRLAQTLRTGTALIPAPAFSEYEQAFFAAGTHILHIPLLEEDRFHLTRSIFPLLSQKPDVLVLCNPNNPTGHTIAPALITEILDVCRQQNTFVLLDECFIDFLDDPHLHTQRHRIETDPNLMILNAFTKIYAMPGLRLGYAFTSNTALLDKMNEISQPWGVSQVAQAAGLAALKEIDYVQKSRAHISGERPWLMEQLSRCGVQVVGGEANYLFFKTHLPDLKELLLQENILIRSCANYNGLTQFYYRVSVRLRHQNEQLLQALSKTLI